MPPDSPSPGARFFCVPGIGGSVLHLHALAQRLGPACRLVALRAGNPAATIQPDNVEQLAARSVETVLKAQPEGTLLLGGYSGGALIAFEMARQLTAQGRTVGLLALIDVRRPGWTFSARTAPAVARNFIRNLPGWARDDLARASPGETWHNVRRRVRHLAGAGPAVERIMDVSRYPADKQQAMQREFDMLESYRPEPWSGRITLLRAQTQPLLLWHDEPALGWAAVAAGGVEIVGLPGNHLTIMREPHVGKLAAALRACIAAATGASATHAPLATARPLPARPVASGWANRLVGARRRINKAVLRPASGGTSHA